MQLSRRIFNDPKYSELSNGAKWFFIVLNELEQRFCGGTDKDFFIRSDAELAKDAAVGLTKLKKDKSELLKTDLVETWQTHWIVDKKTNKMSEKHITAYRILK